VKLATWNINSIRARHTRLMSWLERERPDILCLQETKTEDPGFPTDALREAGYQAVTYGQRSYNGVAICARTEIEEVVRGFGDGEDDAEARLIAARVAGLRVVCVYVPNGGDLDSDKFPYKLAWFRRLRRWLDQHARPDDAVIVCGDMNVTADDRDVCDPVKWGGHIHCTTDERAALAEMVAFGLVDVFRARNPDTRAYSWWDYRGVAFFKDQGLRIDYVFATPTLAARVTACRIDRDMRKGQDASDHAPVIVELT
jgi:exodeoxyribonuclease III